VPLGIAERAERGLDALQADLAGDERPRVDLALGEHVQAVAELERRVAEHDRRSSSLSIAVAGLKRSSPTQTPTTTTREQSGALVDAQLALPADDRPPAPATGGGW